MTIEIDITRSKGKWNFCLQKCRSIKSKNLYRRFELLIFGCLIEVSTPHRFTYWYADEYEWEYDFSVR